MANPIELDAQGLVRGLAGTRLEIPSKPCEDRRKPAAIRKGATPMKLRLWLTLAACVVGASVLAGSAAADPPTKEETSVVGDQFVCGETMLTVTTGVLVTREHVHELRNGRFRVISTDVPKGVRLTDEEGTVYRAVGIGGRANFTTPDPDAEGGEVGFFSIRINFVGPGGLFGTFDFRVRVNRKGEETFRDRGTCQFVEP